PPTPPAPPEGFDVFCFFDDAASMGSILINPNVDATDAGGQFTFESGTNKLKVRAGGAFPTDDALLVVNSVVAESWTLQVEAAFPTLPVDLTDLTHSHIYFGAADDAGLAGLAAGLFVSKAGLAYTGAIALDGFGNLNFGGPYQAIPGTGGLVQ